MKSASMQQTILWMLTWAAATLFSTMALAASLVWEFTGTTTDQQVLTATLTFDSTQQAYDVIEGETEWITETVPVVTEYFTFDDLAFEFGFPGSDPDIAGTTTSGSIIQADLIGDGLPDTYTIEALFESPGIVTGTATIQISGPDLFNSLLTDVNKLQTNLPGDFNFFSYAIGWASDGAGIIAVSDITAPTPSIPAPWTLGLMLSGLASIGFLSFTAVRSRRSRSQQAGGL
jgi:hypothetical protein